MYFVGECIQRVEENAPVGTEFVNSIFRMYTADTESACKLSVEGKQLCYICFVYTTTMI